MKTRLLDWLDDRTGYRGILREALYENVPGGARWRYVWGSTLVFAFVVQAVTGFFLWAVYSPNAQGAWESVYYIQHEMQGGWLLRGVHHFMAQAMVVLLVLHLMQVVVDGAYKAPREINFWLGLVLMLMVLGLSLTGYLLPWDQKGYWATKVATNIMGGTPLIGPELQKLVVGGSEYGHHTLTRFFAIHAGLLPALVIGFLALHIYVFRRHGVTAPSPEWGDDTPFWPDQVLKDAVACLAVLAVVLFLVIVWPMTGGADWGPELGAHLGAPADPTEQYNAARPEWYFLFLFELLKFFPGRAEVIGSHVIPGAVLLILFVMPFLGGWKLGHRFNIGFLCVLFLGVAVLTGMALWKDKNSSEYQLARAEAERTAERMPTLIAEHGIRAEGAVELVRNDPAIQGPKLFARNCAACHRYNGHDGTGSKVTETLEKKQVVDGKEVTVEEQVESKPTAADLGNFGTRQWLRQVVLNYEEHFSAFKNAEWYRQAKQGEDDREYIDLQEGDMAMQSKEYHELFQQEANKESLEAMIEYLVSLSGRPDLKVDKKLAEKGRPVVLEGQVPEGFMTGCADCHFSLTEAESFEPELDNFGPPVLVEYASKAWLKAFISNPGSAAFYGEKNRMPAYKEQLTERELDLLVRWLLGDYVKPRSTDEETDN